MEGAINLAKKIRFFDIAANLADRQFYGEYYDKKFHECDVDHVIQRAQAVGCDRLLVVGGYLEDSKDSYGICQKSEKFYCTVGVHPCRVDEVDKHGGEEKYFALLSALIDKFRPKCVAVGECGLDYDRFDYTPKELQLKYFPQHFDLAHKFNLPMYLHNRNTGMDFFDIVKANRHKFGRGVVHSFTGTLEEMKRILALDLYIGVNGCSLKTEENMAVVKQIPLDRMLLETDSPYCEVRNTHPSSQFVTTRFPSIKKEKWSPNMMVKGRNEPCNVKQVSEIVAHILNRPEAEVAEIAYQNSLKLFGLKDDALPLTAEKAEDAQTQ